MMQTLHQFQENFRHYLNEQDLPHTPAELYEPIEYMLRLGGKRLRPTVLLLGFYLFDEQVDKANAAAFAIELFHNFSLIHDDVMDEAPLRRGSPTVHEKYGINTAILSGDAMLVMAYEQLLSIGQQEKIPAALQVFTTTARQVCEGQQMDMNFETRVEVSIEEYLKMIELKTAVLIAASLKIGAILAGASPGDAQALYEFGRKLGIAFQLQDDLLDAYGDPRHFGKKTGGDIVQGKKTFLYLKAIELADDNTKQRLMTVFQQKTIEENSKIQFVLDVFDRLEINRITRKLVESFLNAALKELDIIHTSPEKKKLMEQFALQLMTREA